MKKRYVTILRYIFLPIMILLIIYQGLFNFKPFIDFVFEFGSVVDMRDFDPDHSDVTYSKKLAKTGAIQLPAEVLQPSGISVGERGILVTTDTSDVYWIDHSGKLISSLRLAGGPLLVRQGVFEAVTWMGESKAAVIGHEGTSLALLSVSDTGLELDRFQDLSHEAPIDMELQSLSYSASTGYLSTAYLDEKNNMILMSLGEDGTMKQQQMIAQSGISQIPGEITGVSSDATNTYVLTSHNIIPKIQNGDMIDVLALDHVADTSGIAVYQDTLYIVTDHEYYQDQLPIYLFDLE